MDTPPELLAELGHYISQGQAELRSLRKRAAVISAIVAICDHIRNLRQLPLADVWSQIADTVAKTSALLAEIDAEASCDGCAPEQTTKP